MRPLPLSARPGEVGWDYLAQGRRRRRRVESLLRQRSAAPAVGISDWWRFWTCFIPQSRCDRAQMVAAVVVVVV